MKIHPMGAVLFHAGGWMDKHAKKVTFAFHNFANVPKNSFCLKITPDTVLIYEFGKTWVLISLNCHLTSTNLECLMNFLIVILAYIFNLII